ncbi:hypothetical protein [Nocardia fluminea]|uniref:hypothetical protein n=1 Tax=Nocardia fluminea TaxID=134984 RepID=UPI00364FE6FF
MNDTRTPSRFGAAVARALSLALYAAGLDLAHLAGLMAMPVEDLRSLLAGERPMMVGDLIAACHAIGVRAGNVIADAERMAAEPLPGDRVRIVESGDLATVTALHRYGIEVVPDCLDDSLIFQREHLELAADELPVDEPVVEDFRHDQDAADDIPVEYLPVSDEERQAHDAAVNDGRACMNCGHIWAIGEPSRPAGFGPSGQLFRCIPACVEVAL